MPPSDQKQGDAKKCQNVFHLRAEWVGGRPRILEVWVLEPRLPALGLRLPMGSGSGSSSSLGPSQTDGNGTEDLCKLMLTTEGQEGPPLAQKDWSRAGEGGDGKPGDWESQD